MRLRRIITAPFKVQTYGCLPPPIGRGSTPEACKSTPPVLRVVVDSGGIQYHDAAFLAS